MMKRTLCRSGKAWVVVSVWALLVVLQGCGSAPPRDNPVPEVLGDIVEVPGIPLARYWADEVPEYIEFWYQASDEEISEHFGGIVGKEHTYLAISGGGANGAFGAGILMGWTQAGTRPEFTIVTGISTGGLIAPFAFLGSDFDHVLKKMYTSYSTDDLVLARSTLNALGNESLYETAQLRALIAEFMTEEVMEAIATEYHKGRSLLIGTTNIDAGRPVMWSLGQIAASGEPGALNLIRDIMLASASIPGAFPPVIFEVEADGTVYQEMHVDGGVTSQVFLYPIGVDIDLLEERLRVQGMPTLYVIRNAYLEPHWKTTERRILPILGRTVSSLIRTQGIGDLYRMYMGSVRDGLEFRLAFISNEIEHSATELFDTEYMSMLFEHGRSLAESGYPWLDKPPIRGESPENED